MVEPTNDADLKKLVGIEYSPSPPDILNCYTQKKLIYQQALAPTIVNLVTANDNGDEVIRKSLKKSMLNEDTIEYAKRECGIHAMLDHENIVKLYDYTETEEHFEMYMEYCNDA